MLEPEPGDHNGHEDHDGLHQVQDVQYPRPSGPVGHRRDRFLWREDGEQIHLAPTLACGRLFYCPGKCTKLRSACL